MFVLFICFIICIIFLTKCGTTNDVSKQKIKSSISQTCRSETASAKLQTERQPDQIKLLKVDEPTRKVRVESQTGFSSNTSSMRRRSSNTSSDNDTIPKGTTDQLKANNSYQEIMDLADAVTTDKTAEWSGTSNIQSKVQQRKQTPTISMEKSQQTSLSASYIPIQEKPYTPLEVRVLEEFREGKRPHPTKGYYDTRAHQHSSSSTPLSLL